MIKKKVLVVEDNLMFSNMLCEVLNGNGYQTKCAYDGNQAVTFAKTLKIDIILLDINMPQKSGDLVYGELKILASTHDIPIIIVSGASPDIIIKLTQKRKIKKDDVFIKPLNFEKLLARINFYLSR